MPKPNPKVLLGAAAGYLRSHPEEILRAMRGAVGLRLGIPLDALRYLAREFAGGKKAPQDVVLEVRPPGLRLEATVRTMGTTLRARLTLFIEEIDFGSERLAMSMRIADMELEVLDGDDTPVAGLIKSGALDLSKPGNLVAYMPKRPEALVDAKDDRMTVDLMKVPKIAQNGQLRRTLGFVTPLLSVAAIRTRDDHLDVHLSASPSRIGDAIATL